MLLLQIQINLEFNKVEKFSKTQISLIINALEMLICENANASNTIKKINDKYKLTSFGTKYISILLFHFFLIYKK